MNEISLVNYIIVFFHFYSKTLRSIFTLNAIGDLITAKKPWCNLDVDICKAYHRYACEYVAGDVTAG